MVQGVPLRAGTPGYSLLSQWVPLNPTGHLQMYSVKTSPRREWSVTWHSASLWQGFGKQGPGEEAGKTGRWSRRSWRQAMTDRPSPKGPSTQIQPTACQCPPAPPSPLSICPMGPGPAWSQEGSHGGESAQVKEAPSFPSGLGASRKRAANNGRGAGDHCPQRDKLGQQPGLQLGAGGEQQAQPRTGTMLRLVA